MPNATTIKEDLQSESFNEIKQPAPPEGGWGYMVCIGLVLVFVPCFAYQFCFGMVFNEFLEDLGGGIGGFSMVNGIKSTTFNMSGDNAKFLIAREKDDVQNELVSNKKNISCEAAEKLLSANDHICEIGNDQKQSKRICIEYQETNKHRYENHLQQPKDENNTIQIPNQVIISSKKKSKWDLLVKYLDLDLLKDYYFVNLACGMAIGTTLDAIFYLLLPLYLYFIKLSMENVALCLSTVYGGDFISRIVVSIVSRIFDFKSRSLFFYGLIGAALLKIIFLHVYSLTGILILCGLLGFSRGCLHIPLSLVYAEYNVDKFAAAFGIAHVLSALFSALITPIFGIIKDLTGTYTASIYLNSATSLLCIVPWTIEFWYMNNNTKNR